MSEVRSEPKTLQEAIVYFTNPDNCVNYLVAHRTEWKDGVTCPTCGSKNVGYIASRRLWQCKNRHDRAQFSVKVGTIMEDSALGLNKWLVAIWMQTSMKNGVSSWEIHRALGITQKCAWHMMHRIRLGLQSQTGGKLSGQIEADETYSGGKARNMHRAKRAAKITGTGGKDKTRCYGYPGTRWQDPYESHRQYEEKDPAKRDPRARIGWIGDLYRLTEVL